MAESAAVLQKTSLAGGSMMTRASLWELTRDMEKVGESLVLVHRNA